jgi:hypothetical protein
VSSLDEYAADVVRQLPNPPRTISTLAIVGQLYRTSGARWLVGFGLVLGLPVTLLFAFVGEGELWARILGLAIVVPTTFMLLAAPAIGGLRLGRALAAGIQVRGEIVTARWEGPGLRPPTFDAASHGMTVGTRHVYHPAGEFDESFESDSRWAHELRPGKQVELLAHPSERRVFFDLGPVER